MVLGMKLHYTNGKPDWESVDRNARNRWQRLAAASQGVLTPGNVVSLCGLVLVGVGFRELLVHHIGRATLWIGLGRVLDIVDGMVANATGTKSPLGEAIDAIFDKLGTLAVLVGAVVEHIVPGWVAALIVLHHLSNSVVAYIGWRHQAKIHPTEGGKLSMTFEWLALGCFMFAAFSSSLWLWPAYILLVPAWAFGFVASRNYLRMVLRVSSTVRLDATKAR
jgi:phosphatidylglycerophosphate synthase